MNITSNRVAVAVMTTVLTVAICLSACTHVVDKHSSYDSDTIKNEVLNGDLCFQKTSGNQKRDTLNISFHFDSNQITGKMTEAIFEKDIRRGTLNGQLNKHEISAVWTYTQEGAVDTLKLEFRLQNGQLLMAPLVYNAKSGRQQVDKNSSTWINVPASDCLKAPNNGNLSVSGTIIEITPGKDGYIATLKNKEGDNYIITMTRTRLQQKYSTVKIGDQITVSGDTIHLNNNINILVKTYAKIK